MRYKTYESDKDGRIYIYPSLDVAGRKTSGTLRVFIKNLIAAVRSKGQKSLR